MSVETIPAFFRIPVVTHGLSASQPAASGGKAMCRAVMGLATRDTENCDESDDITRLRGVPSELHDADIAAGPLSSAPAQTRSTTPGPLQLPRRSPGQAGAIDR